MDQDDPQRLREMERGRQARLVLDSPLYQEAFSNLRAELLRQWEVSPARDSEGREKLWLAVNLLSKIEAHLSEAMTTGNLAQVQLQEQRSRWQSMKDAAKRWA